MVEITRSNPRAFEQFQARLKELDGKSAKAGWFESSKYEDGTPVAYVASIQEFGATITRFGSKAGDYTVVIPPRPFMRPTVTREKQNWMELIKDGAKAVMAGKQTGTSVMEAIGLRAAADIARSITLVTSPPLKPATIAARLRKKSDKRTVGLLDKPLIDSGKMYEEIINTDVNHQVGEGDA